MLLATPGTMVDRAFILAEIRRTDEANGGVALGRQRFESETGIRKGDWLGRFWARWSDAVREAGCEPNRLASRIAEDRLLEKLAELVKKLGRLPTDAELRMKSRQETSFPSVSTFARLGGQRERAAKLVAYCRGHRDADLRVVAQICDSIADKPPSHAGSELVPEGEFGCVYLVKSGKRYKIGRTNSAGRREYEIGLQSPQAVKVVHEIKTDDPAGIERYWYQRFESKRVRGEWFELTPEDVAAFKRRKFQ